MPWFKLDDEWHGHPKVRAAGNAAAGLWARCGCYSSQYLLNGFIPRAIAHELGTKTEIKKVTDAGLWSVVDGGYKIDDFLDYNPSAEQVKKERSAAAERQRRAREAASSKRSGHAVTHAVTDHDVTPVVTPVVTVPPTRPDPTPTVVTNTEITHLQQLPDPSTDDDPLTVRMKAVAKRYAEVRWGQADQGRLGNPAAFKNDTYRKAMENRECARLVREYPEAPVDVLACALNGEKNSLRYFQQEAS